MRDDLKAAVYGLTDELTGWRREFHRHPEVAYREVWTSAKLRSLLEGWGLPVEACAKTGLRAVLAGAGGGGPTVALRADMDALPIEEEGDAPYRSLNPGATHACAHDGHMAILLAVAKVLAAREDGIKGRVVFLFQPSEERNPGGAKPMIEEGALDGVDAVFGLHLWQPLPTGTLGIVKGPMMAQPDDFTIVVRGKGGHGSMPHQAVDPILAAAQLVVSLQSIVSRNVDPLKPAVLSFGSVSGGTIYNVIPGEVSLTGTVRTFDPALQALIEGRMRAIIEDTCRAFGATAEIRYQKGYPALVNDVRMAEFVLKTARDVLGADKATIIDPVMGGEDFAYYLQKVPGAFWFFGAGDGRPHPHHHPAFDIDERALAPAAFHMASLVLDFLERGGKV
ncbi:MAG: amidohydrolase [Candidatus Aminicenantes bacterium]|nr:amidohydrolase [Candidatus Aminicenantes bacterium]